ncbi:hypothetical protein SPBRAN_63 [uncultured Candidatus Thioglobus sp.]|nr:hypothetical protein SPBRAN_63 [uncultured Candidatus Thioglobus sp.]
MNNHQNTTLNKKTFLQACATHAVHQIEDFIKTCRNLAETGFNKNPNLAKSVILPIIPIYAKVSIC